MVWGVPIPVVATVVGSFFGFITALAGFWLNAWLAWKRQQEANALKSTSVRTLIACEIDHNLRSLEAYLNGLNSLTNLVDQPDEGIILVNPQYSQDAYKSQLSAMPLALSPDEIREVFKFYSDLESLTSDNHPNWQPEFETGGGIRSTAAKRRLWRAYKESANDRLSEGNPLNPIRVR